MIRKAGCFVAALVLAAAVPSEASTITVVLGNASPPFADGTVTTSMAALAAQTGAGAFSGTCGADATLNCLASWTFNYVVPVGETVTGGRLSLGLVDIDSVAPGLQVSNYSVTGGADLTSQLNTSAEVIQGLNSQYNVYTRPLSNFAVFNSGSATVNLALQGFGMDELERTNFNGAILMFSRLELISTPDGGNPNPVPDPASSAMLLTTSLGILALARAKNRAR